MTSFVSLNVIKETDPNGRVPDREEAHHSSSVLHVGHGKAGRVELGTETNINDGPWRPLCLPLESRPPPQLPARLPPGTTVKRGPRQYEADLGVNGST